MILPPGFAGTQRIRTVSTSTYIFAGGGSGGHLFPGIAVARELLKRQPDTGVLFVGSDRDVERRILATEQFEHVALPSASTVELTRHPFEFARRNWNAFREAQRLIASRTPRAVIGLGGFASVPMVMAAQRAGLPTLLLEQNATPGRATRWLAGHARRVCLSFEESAAQLPRGARSIVTGNPIRADIAAMAHTRRSKGGAAKTLLILGGSQGAQSVNAAVTGACETLAAGLRDWRVVHQTGAGHDIAVRERYAERSLSAVVQPFITDMAAAYAESDLVVSRAGATTLAELACAGLPAVLIPYPHAARDHQQHNADAFVRNGAAMCVTQQAATETTALIAALRSLLSDGERRDRMSDAMCRLARPNAAQAVVAELSVLGCMAAA